MTIGELIERLSEYPNDAEIFLEGDVYGRGAGLYLDSSGEAIWYSPGTQY